MVQIEAVGQEDEKFRTLNFESSERSDVPAVQNVSLVVPSYVRSSDFLTIYSHNNYCR